VLDGFDLAYIVLSDGGVFDQGRGHFIMGFFGLFMMRCCAAIGKYE
jgi:hypothetical protein